MTQEIIDVVVKSSGTKRVVRDINDIADAAVNAGKKLKDLQGLLNKLSGAGLISQLSKLQSVLASLGQNSNLAGLINQLQRVNTLAGQLRTNTGNVHSGFNSMGLGAISSLRRIEHAITATLAALGVRKVMEWADAWIEAAGKINIFAKNQEEANFIMERIFQIAQTTRQPLTNLADLYHRLTVSGQDLGATQNQMLTVTEAVGKSLAVQGTSITKARGALLQLSQSFGSGRVKAQEFNSVMDGLPILLKVAAKHIDEAQGSTGRLRQMMLNGKLSSKQFFEAILKGAGDMDALFAKAPKTFAQGFTVLTNAVERYLGKINESLGLSDKFFAVTSFIGNNLDTIGKLALIAGVALAAAFVPAGIGALVTGLRAAVPLLGSMVAMLNANPFAVLVTAVAAAYAFGDQLNIGVDNVTTLRDLMVATWPVISGFFSDAADLAGKFFIGMMDLGTVAYNYLTKTTKDATHKWTDSYSEFYADVGSGFAGFTVGLAKTADAIGGLIIGLGIAVVRIFEGLPQAVAEIGKKMYNFFSPYIEMMINGLIEGFNKVKAIFGLEGTSAITLNRLAVDESYFKNYGAHIADAIDEGFSIQGNFLSTRMRKLLEDAQRVASARKAAEAAANNGGSGLDTPLGSGVGLLGKTLKTHDPKAHNDNINAQRTRELLAPSRELTKNAERELVLMQLNTRQHLEQLQAKVNMNRLSERDQFIQQELLKMTDKYEDKIAKVKETMDEMRRSGVLNDVLNPDIQAEWDRLGNMLYNLEQALAKLKGDAPGELGKIFDAMKIDKFADDLNKTLAEALVNGGKSGAKGIRDAIVSELKKPIIAVVQTLLRPVTDAIAGSLGGLITGNIGGIIGAPTSADGGSNLLGNVSGAASLGSLASTIGTAYTAGSTSVGVMAGSIAGGGGMMGGLAAAAGAIPVAGWVALGALALYSMFGGKGGAPKIETGFGDGVINRGDPTKAKDAIAAIQQQYAGIAGRSAQNLDLGFFSATDPKGTALTQLDINATLGGRSIYNRGARLGGIENVGRGEDDLAKAVAEESSRVVIHALQATDLPDKIGEYVQSLGDTDKMHIDTLNKALAKIEKAMKERVDLEERLFQLTNNQDQILARNRSVELAAVDEANRALLERVNLLEDEAKAASKLQDYIESTKDFFNSVSKTVNDFLNKLNTGPEGLLPPEQQLANARAKFNEQLIAAKSGNREALQGITGYADQLIQAQTNYSASGGATAQTIADVKAALSGLPGVETGEEFLARVIRETSQNQVAATLQVGDKMLEGLYGQAGLLMSRFEAIDSNTNNSLSMEELKAYFGSTVTDAALQEIFNRLVPAGGTGVTKLNIAAGNANSIVNYANGAGIDVSNTGFFGFADGGIMTPYGKLPVNKYATGGIVRQPQLYMAGEGSMNEAIIPLPDGNNVHAVIHGGNDEAIIAELQALRADFVQLKAIYAQAAERTIGHLSNVDEHTETTANASRLFAARAPTGS